MTATGPRASISRTPHPRARKIAISSRSANDKYRPDSGAGLTGRIPPLSRNQRVPTTGDTPASMPASSLGIPRAIATHNRCRFLAWPPEAAPANASPAAPPEQLPIPSAAPFAHLHMKVLRRPIESANYTAIRYTERLGDIGAVRSVGSKGDSYDNAAAEAVNSLYKKELINHEGPWQDAGQVTVATAEWVSWYNEDRLHSACGNIPPAEYENAWLTRKGHTIIMPEAKAS